MASPLMLGSKLEDEEALSPDSVDLGVVTALDALRKEIDLLSECLDSLHLQISSNMP